MMRIITLAGLLALLSNCSAGEATPPVSAKAPPLAQWEGNLKIYRANSREYIVGVRESEAQTYPMVGNRTLLAPIYAAEVFPMTMQAQETYVIFDKTRKRTLVYNVVTCLKGKDAANSEKTDWVGELKPGGNHYEGDLMMIRKHDRQGPPLRVPYYSMGRSFPTYLHADGACTIQYNYFGNVKLKLVAREVPDEMLQEIVTDHDQQYREPERGN